MQIFVYEYTRAAPSSPESATLRAEGEAMLCAVLDDLCRVPGVSAITQSDTGNEREEFAKLARTSDYTLIIAPETKGILLQRCRWVIDAGGRLIGPSLAAIERCSDKYRLFETWRNAGVPTPETTLWEKAKPDPSWREFVIKPRDGAGCVATYRVSRMDFELLRRMDFQSARPDWDGLSSQIGAERRIDFSHHIIQPWIEGIAASVSLLIGQGGAIALAPARQHIESDGARLKYAGGSMPMSPELAARAERIARRAIDAVDGLSGCVGVDVVLGDDGRDWAIEINPRLTTSYVGLRTTCNENLMEALVAVVCSESPCLSWRDELVSFAPNGQITHA